MYFFNPKLQECKDFKESYVEIAEKLYGMIKVGAIDCLHEEELCEEFSVFDVPQIVIFTESYSDDGERFRGEMKSGNIINAAAKKCKTLLVQSIKKTTKHGLNVSARRNIKLFSSLIRRRLLQSLKLYLKNILIDSTLVKSNPVKKT